MSAIPSLISRDLVSSVREQCKNTPLDSLESRLSILYSAFMEELGIPVDHNSEDTPNRVARMYLDKTASLKNEPPKITTFPNVSKYDQYIVVKDIPYYSICSHHHVPFYGKASICYQPKDHIVGLSKFARIVQYFANKPQIQEEMTSEIAEYIMKTVKPKGVFVRIDGRHLCMESRGAKAVGSVTVTQQLLGDIDKKEAMSMFRE